MRVVLFEEVVSVVRRYILPNIRLHRRYRQTVHDVICQVTMVFYPSDHPPNHVLNETYGDGNCFFRAVSHALFGTEERHVEIHVRIVFETILNETLHLNGNYLNFGMKKQCFFLTQFEKTLYNNCYEVLLIFW